MTGRGCKICQVNTVAPSSFSFQQVPHSTELRRNTRKFLKFLTDAIWRTNGWLSDVVRGMYHSANTNSNLILVSSADIVSVRITEAKYGRKSSIAVSIDAFRHSLRLKCQNSWRVRNFGRPLSYPPLFSIQPIHSESNTLHQTTDLQIGIIRILILEGMTSWWEWLNSKA